eukprot:3541965-Ditylum_brightwellii.AAC.1
MSQFTTAYKFGNRLSSTASVDIYLNKTQVTPAENYKTFLATLPAEVKRTLGTLTDQDLDS